MLESDRVNVSSGLIIGAKQTVYYFKSSHAKYAFDTFTLLNDNAVSTLVARDNKENDVLHNVKRQTGSLTRGYVVYDNEDELIIAVKYKKTYINIYVATEYDDDEQTALNGIDYEEATELFDSVGGECVQYGTSPTGGLTETIVND
jgi:hypothetical protein